MRRHGILLVVSAIVLGAAGTGWADPAPKTVEELREALIEKAKRERQEELDRKIRLLEALEGKAEPAPKVQPREKVNDSVQIKPSGPRETIIVEWVKTLEQSGDIETSIKNERYGSGRYGSSATRVEPDKIPFTTEQENWRIGWETESMERTGRLKMKLMRKITLPSGLTKWIPHTPLPSLRAGQSGGAYSNGKGEFVLELTGLDVKYKVFVEEAKVEKVTEEEAKKIEEQKRIEEERMMREKKLEEERKAAEKKAAAS